ncbi:MAG: hypothetical protein CM1200mP41_33170 [Gammaproteobacteria bacterium]|nr:MAG: hypothetical protein CM1200mP41_33170 [Gammaproteobacteria bacterium]
MIEVLQARRDEESNGSVLRAIDAAEATLKLEVTMGKMRLASILAVSRLVDSHVRSKLTQLSTNETLSPATRQAASIRLRA